MTPDERANRLVEEHGRLLVHRLNGEIVEQSPETIATAIRAAENEAWEVAAKHAEDFACHAPGQCRTRECDRHRAVAAAIRSLKHPEVA